MVISHRVAFFILLVGSLLTWGKGLSYNFVWDDQYYIVHNQALRHPSRVVDIFTTKEAQKSEAPYPYRPLRTLHHAALTWPLGYPAPQVFHGINLLWQLAVSLLLYYYLSLIFSSRATALASAFLFSVHPVVSEVVLWAKSLDDLMATAFFLAAMIVAHKAWKNSHRADWRALSASIVFFSLSLFSKESTIAMALLFAFPMFLYPVHKKTFALWMISVFSSAGIFWITRHAVLGHTAQIAGSLSGSFLQTMVDMLPVQWLYLKALLGIPPFLPDCSFMVGGYTWSSPAVVWGSSIGLAWVIGLFYFLWRDVKRYFPIWFGIAWILTAYIPVSNLVPMMQYFAVRFAYPMLPGLALIYAFLLDRLWQKSRVLAIALSSLLILLSVSVSWFESAKWQNEASLMKYSYDHAPHSKRILQNYLKTLDAAKNDAELAPLLSKHADLVEINPEIRWINARYLIRAGKKNEGAQILSSLENELGKDPTYWMDRGLLSVSEKSFEKAIVFFKKGVALDPYDAGILKNLGNAYLDSGEYALAKLALNKSLSLAPKDIESLKSLSRAAWLSNDWPQAITAFEKLHSLDPNNPEHTHWLSEAKKHLSEK